MDRKKPNSEYKWQTRASGALLSALAITGLAACSNDTKADGPTSTSPVATSEATPSTSSSEISSGATSTTIEAPTSSETQTATPEVTKNPDGTVSFSVEAFKNNPEALGRAFYEEGFTGWANAGADLKTARDVLDNVPLDGIASYYTNLAEKQKDLWATSLFGKDWASNPAISKVADKEQDVNFLTMSRYFLTGNSENDSRDPSVKISRIGQPGKYYEMDFDVPEDKDNVQVVSASEQQITLVVTNKQFDNLVETNLSGQIDKTTGKPYTAVESTGKIKITFDASAGNYVATSFEPVAA